MGGGGFIQLTDRRDDRDMCSLLVLLFPSRGRAAASQPNQPVQARPRRQRGCETPPASDGLAGVLFFFFLGAYRKRVKTFPFRCGGSTFNVQRVSSCRQFTVSGLVVGGCAGVPIQCDRVWPDPLFLFFFDSFSFSFV